MTNDIYILAGQSNLQGSAPWRDAPASHPGVFCFTSAGQWETAAAPLHRL